MAKAEVKEKPEVTCEKCSKALENLKSVLFATRTRLLKCEKALAEAYEKLLDNQMKIINLLEGKGRLE